MSAKSIDLAWIVVKDLKKASQFYTEAVGMKLMNKSEEYGWAELLGKEGGARLGIAEIRDQSRIMPGQNAVLTFTVDHLETAKNHALKSGAKAIDEIQEVPGHVKMQLFLDSDGNHFQIVQMLGEME